MDDDWSLKKLIRDIVLSRTYRQSSTPTETAYQIDPENRLLSRHNVRRLDFESARDSILAAADQLDLTMGGPSVSIIGGRFSAAADRVRQNRAAKPA